MRELTSFTVRSGSRRVAISARVRSAGDDLVMFVHGLGCAKESFDLAFSREWPDDFSLCSFDLPSHGSSDPVPPDGGDLEDHAEIVIDLVERLGPTRLYLVCHSMGGAVGLLAATELTNLACFISVEGNLVAADCGLVSRRIADQSRDEFVARGFAGLGTELATSGRADLQAWAGWYRRCDPSGLHQSARSLVQWSDSGKLLEMFASLSAPRYVHGEHSDLGHVLSILGDAGTYRIPSAGHFCMLENPGRFYPVVASLVTEAAIRTTSTGPRPGPERRGPLPHGDRCLLPDR